jgi:regulatory protein
MLQEIRHAAMKMLVRREQAASELRRKLSRKFPMEEECIEREIKKLAEDGYQSDLRYAEMVVRSGIAKYNGPIKITAELRSKKIDELTINKAFTEEDTDWSKLIVLLDEKKFGLVPQPSEVKDIAKRMRFYQSKGYKPEHIDLVVREDMFDAAYAAMNK